MKMKRMISMLLAFVLVAGIGAGIIPTDARAAKDATVGEYYNWCIYQQQEYNINSTESTGTPPGMKLKVQSDAVFLQGTPTKAGTYNMTITVCYDDGTPNYTFYDTITILAAGKEKINVTQTYNMTVGVSGTYKVHSSTYGRMDDFTLTWNGLTLKGTQFEITLSGTPQAAGTHTFSKTVDDEYTADVILSITVKVAEPVKTFSITKSPTKETKTEGESALFIAAAENYDSVEWIVANKSGSETYTGKSAIEKAFTGISVSLYQDKSGRECMNLKNLPMSINGYYIKAKFWNAGKTESKVTDAALLTVKEAAPNAPTISGQSSNANLKPGEKVTLSVTAKAAEGTTLQYQWFRILDDASAEGEKLSGATSSSYTPEERTGTTYYYCVVTAIKNSKASAETVSDTIEVFYEAPAPEPEPEPAPEPEPEPEPVPEPDTGKNDADKAETEKTPNKDEDEKPIEAAAPEKAPEKSDHTIAFLIAGLAAIGMICGTVLYIVNKRKD